MHIWSDKLTDFPTCAKVDESSCSKYAVKERREIASWQHPAQPTTFRPAATCLSASLPTSPPPLCCSLLARWPVRLSFVPECAVWYYYSHHKLLFRWNNDALKDQVAMFGKPPDPLWQNRTARDDYFHPDGTSKEDHGRRLKVQPLSLEQRVRNLEKPLSERGYETGFTAPLPPDLQNLYDLLKEVIIYDAGSRLSFETIQVHPFFRDV